ncbi:MAG: hypothetical protein ACRDD0_01415, partial [Bacteroidales bacterium]
PEDENADWNYGYKQNIDKNGKISIDTIIVNDAYAENNPLWIINSSTIHYDDLPKFSNGEFVKGNTLFACDMNKEQLLDDSHLKTKAIGDKVYTVYIGSFMADKQYDSVFRGGSDFVLQMGQAQNFSITAENLTSLDMHVSFSRIHRSRKDIKKKRWTTVNTILVSDWLPEENNAAFMIHEDDGGGTKRWDADISVSLGDKNYGTKVSIPYGKKDELIHKIVYSRNFIFSSNNSEGTVHHASGVHFTLPYRIGRVVE